MYQGRPKEALKAFLEAEKDGNRSINNRIMIAKVYLLLNNKKEAKRYASMVCQSIPEDYQQVGSARAYYTVRQAEALTILGETKKAEAMLEGIIDCRKCDNCKYCQCIDAYCALVYLYCILGEEEKARQYLQMSKKVAPFDYDLLYMIDIFMKKRGLFR